MTLEDLITRAHTLEMTIRGATPATRLDLQPEFNRVLHRIRHAGGQIPAHLRRLDQVLGDELTESRFDNMPV